MNKKLILIIIYVIGTYCSTANAFSSSSYLITNLAIKFFEYEKAYSHFKNNEINFNEKDLTNKMYTFVISNFLKEAAEVSNLIIKKNKFNQQAWLVKLIYSIKTNDENAFNEYKSFFRNEELPLVKYIFYSDFENKKNRKLIARSIYEIVQGSFLEISTEETNYKLLLFYLMLCINLDDDLKEVYFYTAQIYQIIKKYNKSIEFFEKIPKEHILYFDSQISIAINKSNLNKFIEAENHLIKLINLYPENYRIKLSLADLYRYNKKYKKGINYYSEIIKSENETLEDYWRFFFYRGICYERSLDWKKAEDDFLKSLNINKESSQVLNYLAYGWLERDQNLNQALNMLKKAYEKDPNSHHILDSLAWAYYKTNQLQKAVELMEEVISMAPGEAISLDHLGDIYYALNRKREASFFWRQAKDLAQPEDMIEESINKKLENYYAG